MTRTQRKVAYDTLRHGARHLYVVVRVAYDGMSYVKNTYDVRTMVVTEFTLSLPFLTHVAYDTLRYTYVHLTYQKNTQLEKRHAHHVRRRHKQGPLHPLHLRRILHYRQW